jgi:hypothetical protein
MKGQATVPIKGVDKTLFCKLDQRKRKLTFANKESSLIATLSVDLVSFLFLRPGFLPPRSSSHRGAPQGTDCIVSAEGETSLTIASRKSTTVMRVGSRGERDQWQEAIAAAVAAAPAPPSTGLAARGSSSNILVNKAPASPSAVTRKQRSRSTSDPELSIGAVGLVHCSCRCVALLISPFCSLCCSALLLISLSAGGPRARGGADGQSAQRGLWRL